MADHAKPILTDNYTDVLSQIRGRFEDQAKGFDPANTTATNISTGTIRWNSAEKKFQKWSGAAWGDLTDNYVLSGATFSTGTANGVAYLNGSKVLTTGSALTFDGTNLSNTGRYIVTANSAGTTDVSYGRLSGGAWINTPTGAPGYLAAAGTAAFYWDSNNLISYIGGSEQMRLTSTGLGIGTSSPATKLDVNGDFTQRNGSGTIIGTITNSAGWYDFGGSSNVNGAQMSHTSTLRFLTASTERMRLDASGNLGLGVTPYLGLNFRTFQLNRAIMDGGASDRTTLAYNYARAGGVNTYIGNDFASSYQQIGGHHQWLTAPSGTAGNAISFTQAMTLNASGNLLVGNTNGTSRITASGVIESTTGGFKFPDGTTQTTAAVLLNAVGAVGTYALLRYNGTGTVSAGMVVSSDSNRLGWSSAAGHTGLSYVPPGQLWRCMGEARDTNDAIRTTLFLRLS